MTPGIDPKVDYAFKRVFGSEANADLLQDLLESVLGFALSSVELINPFNEKETSNDKLSILDIKARDAEGRSFGVEMQMVSHVALVDRLLYYWARLYTGQLVEGKGFEKLLPAYAICFVNRRIFKRRPDVPLNRFVALDPATGETLSEHFSVNVVELPKFTKAVDEVGTHFEGWCYYFQHAASLDPARMPAKLDRPAMRKAMEVLMKMSQSEIERERYESRLMAKRDMEQFEYDATHALEKGIKQGMKEGMARGGLHGEIRGIQRAFGQPVTPDEELEKLSLDDLKLLVERLSQQGSSGK